MTLPDRDRAVVSAVAAFGQMTTTDIYRLIFPGTTRKPCDRALARLTAGHYLHRIERRMAGGAKGGSGQYVYCLGRRGWYLFNQEGRYSPDRAVNYHSLSIVECYLTVLDMDRAGALKLVGWLREPHCHMTIGGHELRPDLLLEVERFDGRRGRRLIEVDMATQGPKQIKDKLTRYWRAFQVATPEQWPEHTRVAFAVPDRERVTELEWLIEQGPQDARGLFSVVERSKLASLFI